MAPSIGFWLRKIGRVVSNGGSRTDSLWVPLATSHWRPFFRASCTYNPSFYPPPLFPAPSFALFALFFPSFFLILPLLSGSVSEQWKNVSTVPVTVHNHYSSLSLESPLRAPRLKGYLMSSGISCWTTVIGFTYQGSLLQSTVLWMYSVLQQYLTLLETAVL